MQSETRPNGGPAGAVASLSDLVALRDTLAPPSEARSPLSTRQLAGPFRSRFRGSGLDFDEVRPYQSGDDVRHIDWAVTARTGRPHTRVFHEERERPVWLAVDEGPGMHFGTRRAFKSVVAAGSAAVLAWIARSQGNRVGGIVRSTERVDDLAARWNEPDFIELLRRLALGTETHGAIATESFDTVLARLARRARRGDRAFVISDFQELQLAGQRHLVDLAGRCDLTCVLVYDLLETSAPPPGEYCVTDGEHTAQVEVRGRAARRRYASSFEDYVQAFAGLCRRQGIQLVKLRTDDDVAAASVSAYGPLGRGVCRGGRR